MSLVFFFILSLLPPGVIRHGIDKNKSLELAKRPEYSSVCMFTQNGKIKGSCVMIHPRLALTAAHCLKKLNDSDPLYIETDSIRFSVDSFLIHPNFELNKECDLALLYLSPSDLKVHFPKLYSKKNEIGQIGTSVGYGNFSVANNPRDILDAGTLKSAGQNTLDSLAGNPIRKQRPLLLADFDSPDGNHKNKTGSSKCLDMEFGLDGGDSGGGMFIQKGKHHLLAGINAFQNKSIAEIIRTRSFYGSESEWVRISVFRKWINRKLKEYIRVLNHR